MAARACNIICAWRSPSVDRIIFGRPEVIITFAPQKFDEKTLELKDQTAIDLIKQQLAGFEKFARKVCGKA